MLAASPCPTGRGEEEARDLDPSSASPAPGAAGYGTRGMRNILHPV